MKSVTIILGLILLATAGATAATQTVDLGNRETTITVTDMNTEGITFDIEIGEINLTPVETDKGTFVELAIDGFAHTMDIGAPALPARSRLIAIPFGADLEVSVQTTASEVISLTDLGFEAPILPAQPMTEKGTGNNTPVQAYNKDAYESSDTRTTPIAFATTIGTVRGLHLARVSFLPVKYDHDAKSLTVHRSCRVTVTYNNADWQRTAEHLRRSWSPYFEAVYTRVSNYPDQFALLTDPPQRPDRYVIVADRMFQSTLQPFIDWKTEKGFEVITAYTDVIGNTTTAIKTWLQSLYDDPVGPPPTFVLLVGDDPAVPAWERGPPHRSVLLYLRWRHPPRRLLRPLLRSDNRRTTGPDSENRHLRKTRLGWQHSLGLRPLPVPR